MTPKSANSQQILRGKGFISGHLSMDDDTYAYDGTKQAFYDGRIKAPKHDKAQREMCSLEFNSKKLKIDHPPKRSKDVSDAMAGVVWGLTIRREILFPFMLNAEAVSRCFGVVKSIGSRNDLDFKTTELRIKPELVTNPGEPRYIHCDLARTKDSAGLAMGYVERFVEMDRGDYKEKLPLVVFDLVVEIMPPPGGEIIYSNIRQLIYNLRDVVGLPIKWVSFDQYQTPGCAEGGGHQSGDLCQGWRGRCSGQATRDRDHGRPAAHQSRRRYEAVQYKRGQAESGPQ